MTPAEHAALALAAPSEIVNGLSRTSANFTTDKLLSSGNKFQHSVSKKVDKLCKSPGPYNEPDLVESIAISAILHLFDGWSYFAEALKATFRSEHGIARHLSYYSELRSSMSILASHGVGIYNSNHVIVVGGGNIIKYPANPGTHIMAWEALKEWGKSSYSGSLVGNDIYAFGVTLNDWITSFQATATLNISGAEWVEKWGLDLSRLTTDRKTRNEVSYGVCFDHKLPRQTPSMLEPWLREIWLASEPSASPFSALDQYLIRSTLEGIFNTKFKNPADTKAQSKNALIRRIEGACASLGITEAPVIDFMTRRLVPKDLEVMRLAAKRSNVNDPMQYQEVLSRSFLLLRLASASVRSLVLAAGLKADDLGFWWQHVLSESGVWRKSSPPSDIEEAKDLWADIQLSLDELSDFTNHNPNSCWFDLHSTIASEIENLSRVEKVALWGLA
jgi:hypothetical protein